MLFVVRIPSFTMFNLEIENLEINSLKYPFIGPNALCNVVNQRAQCTCPAGFLAYPTPNTACVREPTPCTGTKSCAAGFTCQNSVCRPLCSADSQCLVNERCSQGMCVPVCRQDTDCSSGEICSMGSCKTGCRTDPDCPTTHACLNAQCVAVCASPAACGTNAKCQGVNHRAQCACMEGLVGNAKVACRYPPSTCSASGECLANQKCIGGMCRPGCTRYNQLPNSISNYISRSPT